MFNNILSLAFKSIFCINCERSLSDNWFRTSLPAVAISAPLPTEDPTPSKIAAKIFLSLVCDSNCLIFCGSRLRFSPT